MVDIYISQSGCRTAANSSTPFKCQMCNPKVILGNPITLDNARSCAMSKISKGLIYYYYELAFDKDLFTGKKTLISKTLIEKWKDK